MRAKILNKFVDESGVVRIEYAFVAPRKNEIAFPVERSKFAGSLAALGAKRNNLMNEGVRVR